MTMHRQLRLDNSRPKQQSAIPDASGNQLNIICAAEVVVALACRTDTLVLLRGYPRPVPMLIAYDNEQVLAMVSSSSTGGQRQLARSRGIGRDRSGVLDDSKKNEIVAAIVIILQSTVIEDLIGHAAGNAH